MTVASESAAAIAIFKENIITLANYRRTNIEETVTTTDAAMRIFIRLVHPQLDYLIGLAKNFEILESLKELTVQEKDYEAWMSAEYKQLLNDEVRSRGEFKHREKSLEALCGALVDAYNAYRRLKRGVDYDGRGRGDQALRETVMTGDCESIIRVFTE